MYSKVQTIGSRNADFKAQYYNIIHNIEQIDSNWLCLCQFTNEADFSFKGLNELVHVKWEKLQFQVSSNSVIISILINFKRKVLH